MDRTSLLIAFVAVACGGTEESFLDSPLGAFPERLSEVGIYPDPAERSEVAAGAIGYEPRWPLWSNGSHKQRFAVLPPGFVIDNSDRTRWTFPAGTLFFKTFSYDELGDGALRPIETRVIRVLEEGWDAHVYQWNEDASDAERLALDTPVEVTVRDRGSEPFTHAIPSRRDCRKCHESEPAWIIGFDELRLNHTRDGAAETQLEALSNLFAETPPSDAERISHEDELTRDVLGYVHGNCAHCHNGGTGQNNSFDMRYPVFEENTIGRMTEGLGTAPGIRIEPGEPQSSILFLAFSGETDNDEIKSMPPVGVQRRDAEAIEMLRAWILSLEP